MNNALLKLLKAAGPDRHVQLSYQAGCLVIAVPGARPGADYVYSAAADPEVLENMGYLNQACWVDGCLDFAAQQLMEKAA